MPEARFELDPATLVVHLFGDESAITAIGVLLEELPQHTTVLAAIEVGHDEAEVDLPDHPRAMVRWLVRPAGAPPGSALVAAAELAKVGPRAQVWAGAEASVARAVRGTLLDREVPADRIAVAASRV